MISKVEKLKYRRRVGVQRRVNFRSQDKAHAYPLCVRGKRVERATNFSTRTRNLVRQSVCTKFSLYALGRAQWHKSFHRARTLRSPFDFRKRYGTFSTFGYFNIITSKPTSNQVLTKTINEIFNEFKKIYIDMRMTDRSVRSIVTG
jgi:hypothetical protein